MTNPYYNPTGVPAQGAAVTSAVVRTEFVAIQAGFDKMPTLSGNGNKLVKVNAAGDAMTVSVGIVDAASSTVLTIDSSSNLLVGLTDASRFVVVNNGISAFGHVGDSVARLFVAHYKNAASAPNAGIVLVGSRGTESAYSALASGDQLGFIGFGGDSGSALKANQASIFGVADEAWSATNLGTRLAFYTTPNGSTVVAERMRIANDGTITLGGANTAPSLKVNPYTAGNWVTISSGTNPTIGTSGGNLACSSATGYLQVNNGGTYAGLIIDGATSYASLLVMRINGTEVTRISSDAGQNLTFSTGSAAATQVAITHTASATNYLTLTGAASNAPAIYVNGVDTNVALKLATKGSGAIRFITDYLSAGAEQVQITHTAGATKYITLTGGNAGNPTISTNVGDLSLTSAANMNLLNSVITLGVSGSTINLLATSGATTMNIRNTNGNLNLDFSTAGTLNLRSHDGATARTMVTISHTAGADRWITMTGSNGGNPTIGVSAGNLAVSAALVGSASLSASTFVSANQYLTTYAATTTPAGGHANCAVYFSSDSVGIQIGSGAPSTTPANGSIYIRTDGGASTTIYQRRAGAWVATAA